ncbi:MAG: hypothetical protein J7M14_07390, partial [Planctomycetes bacterium]|nr:hypothetical protein [Planctomycetota bacterium]
LRCSWLCRVGVAVRDIQRALGRLQTTWDLFNGWNHDGTLDKILKRLRLKQELDPELWCIDGTIARAARCASGGGKKRSERIVGPHARAFAWRYNQ